MLRLPAGGCRAAPSGRGAEQQEVRRLMKALMICNQSNAAAMSSRPTANTGRPELPRPSAKDVVPERPNQLWIADLTYVAIPGGFVISPSSWMPGHARWSAMRSAGRWSLCVAVAALKSAINNPPAKPPKGLLHHSDKGIRIRFGGVSCSAC